MMSTLRSITLAVLISGCAAAPKAYSNSCPAGCTEQYQETPSEQEASPPSESQQQQTSPAPRAVHHYNLGDCLPGTELNIVLGPNIIPAIRLAARSSTMDYDTTMNALEQFLKTKKGFSSTRIIPSGMPMSGSYLEIYHAGDYFPGTEILADTFGVDAYTIDREKRVRFQPSFFYYNDLISLAQGKPDALSLFEAQLLPRCEVKQESRQGGQPQ